MGDNEFKTRYRKAVELYRQGKCAEALNVLDALDQAVPNKREIMWPRAQCLQRLGRTDDAIEVCDALIAQFGDERAIAMKQEMFSRGFDVPESAPAAYPAARSELDHTPKKGHRIIGIDLARAIAIFGMVIVNYKNAMSARGGLPDWLIWCLDRFEGRASVTFVTLAGMGLVLLSYKARESGDSALKRASTSRIFKRALFLLVIGMLNYQIWPGDILHFYGFYMAMAALLLFTPSWTPLVGAAAVLVVTFFLNETFDHSIGWENGHRWYNGYLTPVGFVRNTFLNGYHPVFHWAAYCMVGIWLARRKIFDRNRRRLYLLVCIPLAVLVESADNYRPLTMMLWRPDTGVELLDTLMHLLVMRPYLVSFLARQLVAISVILVSLELADRFQNSRIIGALATTGRMALTHYLGHTILVIGPLFLLGTLEGHSRLFSLLLACGYLAAAVTFSVLYAKRFKQGPLEALMRLICG